MAEHFYTVEILHQPISFDTISYLNSVKLTEFSAQKKIREIRLGYMTKEDVYFNLERGHYVNLDKAYVKDFSLKDYRELKGLSQGSKVVFHGFSCVSAFFDCDSSIDFSDAIFEETALFTDCIFSHGTLNFTRAEFKADLIDFSECKFHAHKTTFEHVRFNGKQITFEHASFGGEGLSFVNASFNAQEINFKRVNFGYARVRFQFAEFGEGNKLFERIRVMGSVFDFRRVIFGSGRVDFRRAMFGTGYVTFEESQITDGRFSFRMSYFEGGDISFRRMDFGKDEANFDHVDFNNRSVSFESIEASVLSVSNSKIHGNLDLRIKRADKIDLSHSYLYSITDLNFLKKDALHALAITGVRNLGKIILKWDDNNVREIVTSSGLSHGDLADQFNILKDNFSNNGQYSDEDSAYIWYMRHEHFYRKETALSDAPAWKKIFIRFSFWVRYLIFDRMGLYATSPARVLFSMIVAIIGFAAIYMVFHITGVGEIVNSVGASDKLDVVDRSLYHSAITFFTIGYGDYYPTSFSRLISALEGWVGVFMMSYFTVAFVRKILR